jgi:hypothetical protein
MWIQYYVVYHVYAWDQIRKSKHLFMELQQDLEVMYTHFLFWFARN